MRQAKTEVALQFSECCAAEVALQHSLFCNADVFLTKSCAAASEKLQCNIEKAALQEGGPFLPLSCGFQAPTFRRPRLGPAEPLADLFLRRFGEGISFPNFGTKLCAVPFALQNRALFKGGKGAKRCREKGGKRGGQQRGQKGKKDA